MSPGVYFGPKLFFMMKRKEKKRACELIITAKFTQKFGCVIYRLEEFKKRELIKSYESDFSTNSSIIQSINQSINQTN